MTQLPTVTEAVLDTLDLSVPQRLHVVGVGGPGMSAIAIVLAEMGHTVSGSDLRERPILDRLRAGGVTVHVGHRRSHVDGCDAVTYSTAVPASNIELDAARASGIPIHAAGRHAGRHLRAGAVVGGRRHARQDHDHIDAHADAGRGAVAPQLHHRRRRHRHGHGCAVDRWR